MPELAQDTKRSCQVFRAGDAYAGKQGLSYAHGISAERAGAQGICMHVLNIPSGGRAQTHLHEDHETAIYVLSGRGRMWHGAQLENVMDFGPGDMIFIPPGVPPLPANPYDESFVAVVARTDPNEQESVVLRPDLDPLVSFEH